MSIEIKKLPVKTPSIGLDPRQGELDLGIDKHTEIQGIGMGVLTDGTAFLNQRGLARLCGVENRHIGTIGAEWQLMRPRIVTIKKLIESRSDVPDLPYIRVMKGGKLYLAHPDYVCLAVLEYFAFDAGPNCKEEARRSFRTLAGKALQDFIYTQVGYSPSVEIPLPWRQFHDRVSLVYDSVPFGYFSVFKEIADIVVTLIRGGAEFGPDFLPDISVGQHWAKHWTSNDLEQRFGPRRKYEHNYPAYFPQAASNPQEPHCYPNEALAEFRRWMHEVYLPTKLPNYLAKIESKGLIPPSFSEVALSALKEKRSGRAIETGLM